MGHGISDVAPNVVGLRCYIPKASNRRNAASKQQIEQNGL